MTLGNIRDRILRTTKTAAAEWGTTYADMAIDINIADDRLNSIIRTFTSTYASTAFSGSDVSTGTSVPKSNTRFHELYCLWPEYNYAMQNDKNMVRANKIMTKISALEREARVFYGLRNYRIATMTIAAPAVITLDNHCFNTNDRVIFETTGALPTGFSAETWYYVIRVTDHTFKLTATRDGSAITSTGSQSGTHYIGQERQGRARRNYDSNR